MKPVIIIAIAVVVIVGTMVLPNAYARDFSFSTECEKSTLKIFVFLDEDKPLPNVTVRTSVDSQNKFITDENGLVEIPYEKNNGWVWISKGGYNDKKINIETCSLNQVPSWIKVNAQWWIEGAIDEESFLQGIRFLIKNEIIKIQPISDEQIQPATYQPGQRIPSWVITNVEWWVNGKLNDDTFIQGMQFLIINGIINLKEQTKTDNLAVDSTLPTVETFEKLGISKPDWTIYIDHEGCGNVIGVISDSSIYAINSDSMITAFICKFDKLSNANRGFTGSTTYDEEIMQTSPYVGSSKLTGPCYISGGIVGTIRDVEVIIGGCTYGNYIVGVTITSNNSLEESFILETFVALMDEMLDNMNSIKGNTYDTSIAEVLNLYKQPSSSFNTEIVTGDTSAEEGFSGLYCKRSSSGNYVEMTGRYTNGPDSYSSIYFTLGVLDYQDRIVSTGLGDVSNIGPYQTKIFEARAPWTGDFKECIIEVDWASP